MNRQQRRHIEALRRHFDASVDLAMATSRAGMIRLVAELAEADPTVSGATIITPQGEVSYVDAGMLRGGGRA